MSKKEEKAPSATSVEAPPNTTVRQVKVIPSLMSCVFVHKVADNCTEAQFQWTGKKLNPIWPQILAFFKWTNDEFKSESQVRLFVNQRTGEWKAWAFPQKARTGMTAKELTEGDEGYEKTKEQRAMFSDTEGWYYWGTVHHHCDASAFQSSTDTENERNQDGIHITVGNLSAKHHSVHFRLYIGGFRLKGVTELMFWDTMGEMNTVPEKFRSLLPANTEQILARHQMGIPAPPGTEFPKEWRENIIDVRPKDIVVSHPVGSGGVTYGGYVGVFGKTYTDKSTPNLVWDLKRAYDDIKSLIRQNEGKPNTIIKDIDMVVDVLTELDRNLDFEVMDIMAICVQKDVLPDKLAEYIDQQQAIEELHAQQLEQAAEGGASFNPPTVHTAGKPKSKIPYGHPDWHHWSER